VVAVVALASAVAGCGLVDGEAAGPAPLQEQVAEDGGLRLRITAPVTALPSTRAVIEVEVRNVGDDVLQLPAETCSTDTEAGSGTFLVDASLVPSSGEGADPAALEREVEGEHATFCSPGSLTLDPEEEHVEVLSWEMPEGPVDVVAAVHDAPPEPDGQAVGALLVEVTVPVAVDG
jgi:hypothetical protein